jgi:sugar O-acyltransferase (sialic acid O-acetyltransferase NeuD family)
MKLNKRQFVIAGAGGFGKEVWFWLKDYASSKYGPEGNRWYIRGFLDDNPDALEKITNRAPSLGSITDYIPEPDDVIVMGIGVPKVRRAVAQRLIEKKVPFETVIHPKAFISSSACLGSGTIVAPFVAISEDTTLGNFLLINFSASIGHDAVIEDFSELCPHVSVSGFCHIEPECLMGSNSSITPGKKLSRGTQVSAGTAVMRNTRPYGFVQGVPGKEHRDFFKPKEEPEELVLSDYPLTRPDIPKSTR